jgi:hypothetical protein
MVTLFLMLLPINSMTPNPLFSHFTALPGSTFRKLLAAAGVSSIRVVSQLISSLLLA